MVCASTASALVELVRDTGTPPTYWARICILQQDPQMLYIYIDDWEAPSWQVASLSLQAGKIQSLHSTESWIEGNDLWKVWIEAWHHGCFSSPALIGGDPCQSPKGMAASEMMTEFTSAKFFILSGFCNVFPSAASIHTKKNCGPF